MKPFIIYPIKSNRIINFGDKVFEVLKESVSINNFEFQDGDVLVVTSKVVSMEQKMGVNLRDIIPTEKANVLAEQTLLDPRFVQIILNQETTDIFGHVKKAILTITPYGAIPNAGIDQSNSPSGWVILLPKDLYTYIHNFYQQLQNYFGKTIYPLIMDSTVNPLRQGTSGIALAVAGFDPVIDERGKKDLYGYTMSITTRAIADNIATAANLVMGETAEMTPFAVVRGLNLKPSKKLFEEVPLIPKDQCLFIGPLYKLRSEVKGVQS